MKKSIQPLFATVASLRGVSRNVFMITRGLS